MEDIPRQLVDCLSRHHAIICSIVSQLPIETSNITRNNYHDVNILSTSSSNITLVSSIIFVVFAKIIITILVLIPNMYIYIHGYIYIYIYVYIHIYHPHIYIYIHT